MKYDIRGSLWFRKIGIVRVKVDNEDRYEYYLGEGEGVDQDADEQFIASFGTRVFPSIINAFLSVTP